MFPPLSLSCGMFIENYLTWDFCTTMVAVSDIPDGNAELIAVKKMPLNLGTKSL